MWKVSEKCPYSELFCSHAVTFAVCLRIQSECGKILTRKAPNTDSFHAVDSYCQSYFQKEYTNIILLFYNPLRLLPILQETFYQFYKKRFTNYTRNVLPIIQETLLHFAWLLLRLTLTYILTILFKTRDILSNATSLTFALNKILGFVFKSDSQN